MVIARHVLKAALIPTLTIVGLQLGYLLGGSVIIEWVFGSSAVSVTCVP